MTISPIAYARNGFTDKFGIPRQSRADSVLMTRIEFAPEYRDANAIRGIDGYSHLWLIWEFTKAESTAGKGLTVRPPRLGGNERMGVFATRSPYRPNPLGLTSVELIRVEKDGSLLVRGADLLDGTPIYDIKPYLSFSDSHPDARNGFAEAHRNDHLEVQGIAVNDEIREILSQDPRPAYHDDPNRIYHLEYAGKKIAFRVEGNVLTVTNVNSSDIVP